MKLKASKKLFLYSTIIASSLSMEKPIDSDQESRLLKQQHEKEEKKMEPTNFDITGQIETKQESDLMEFYDESGQQIFIEKQVYREKILPYTIQSNWNDPQELYDFIVGNIMEFPQELEEAAKRQLEIDPNKERSFTVASIVMMKNQKCREARQLLERYLESHKPSAVILTNLAKTYEDDKSRKEILWKAIQLDPNYSHCIDFWLVIIRENEGEEAYYNSLKVLSQLPDTWYPQLYLAREHIENKDLTTALPLLKHVLNTAPLDSDALLIISGDLGQNGFIQEILDIVLPYYTCTAGNSQYLAQNILQAFYELKKGKEGFAFIEKIRSQQDPNNKSLQHIFSAKLLNSYESMLKAI